MYPITKQLKLLRFILKYYLNGLIFFTFLNDLLACIFHLLFFMYTFRVFVCSSETNMLCGCCLNAICTVQVLQLVYKEEARRLLQITINVNENYPLLTFSRQPQM